MNVKRKREHLELNYVTLGVPLSISKKLRKLSKSEIEMLFSILESNRLDVDGHYV
jgi:hypothetical protein